MIVQFVKAMQECEERQVNHFRLCPTCILLKKDMYVLGKIFLVVTDFSLGKDFCTD